MEKSNSNNQPKKVNKLHVIDDYKRRLMHAKKMHPVIKDVKKLSESDREQFAHNLYQMVSEIQQKLCDKTFNFAKVFDLAFGNNSPTSKMMQRKRKTLILDETERLDGQSLSLVVQPEKYLKIAEALHENFYRQFGKSEHYGILRLIKDSSYDYDVKADLSFSLVDSEETDVLRCLAKCVKAVKDSVDLAWMNEWLKQNYTTVVNIGGKVQKIEPSIYSSPIAQLTFVEQLTSNHTICPSVRLQELRKKANIDEQACKLPINGSHGQDVRQLLVDTFIDYCAKSKSIDLDQDYILIEDDVPFEEKPNFTHEMSDDELVHAWECDGAKSKLPINLSIIKYLDLDVAYHDELETWSTYLVERYEVNNPYECYGPDYRVENLDSGETDIYFLGQLFGDYSRPLFGFIHTDKDDSTHAYYFFTKETDVENDFRFIFPFAISEEAGLFFERLYMKENSGNVKEQSNNKHHIVNAKTLFKVPENAIVRQEPGTLANEIVANLLFTEGNDNLLNRLVADAEYKHSVLEKHVSEINEVYTDKLNKFLSS